MREKSKVTSIRGIDQTLYSRITAIAKEMGKTVGEIMNEAMRFYLVMCEMSSEVGKSLDRTARAFMEGFREGVTVAIADLEEVHISKADLEKLKRKVRIHFVKRVVFDSDVDEEAFDKYVSYISDCGEVVVPASIPKLLVYSKCRRVTKVVFR